MQVCCGCCCVTGTNEFALQPVASDELPALWVLVPATGRGSVLAPVCASPGHLHVVTQGCLSGDVVTTSNLTTVEVQRLTTMAVVMCGDKTTLATPTAEAATGTTATLADMLGKVRHQLVKTWRPSSTALLWVCKEHQIATAL